MIQDKKVVIVLITLMLTSLTIAADANDVDNIIVNSGFEAGNLWGYHYAMYTAFKSGVPGDANFNGPSAPGTSCVLMKGAPTYQLANIRTFQYCVRPGNKFVAHWDYRSDYGAGTLTAHLRFLESATGLAVTVIGAVDVNLPNSGSDWAVYAVSMVAPPGTEAVDVYFNNFNGWVKLDNIIVYEETAGPPPSASAIDINDSIINNPSFENRDPNFIGEPNLTGTAWFSSNGNTGICMSDNYPAADGNCAEMTRASGTSLMADVRSPACPIDGDNDRLAIAFSYKTLPGFTGLGFAQLRFWRSSDVSGIGHLNELSWALPPTNGEWKTIRSCCVRPPEEATYLDFRVGLSSQTGAEWGNGVGTLRLDNVILINTTPKGDLSCNCHVDSIDLGGFASHWLYNESSSEVRLVVDNFESYANQTALDANWSMITGSEPNRGTGSLTLLTNPGDVYEGSRALRFDYNDTSHGEPNTRTEFCRFFSPIDINEYDELRVWIKRHGGNSEENILYFKLYNGDTTPEFIQLQHHLHWVDGSTYADPNQWVEWVADLRENPDTEFLNGAYSIKGFASMRGIIFGCESSAEHPGGKGTIDFDRIEFINYPEGDLNKDGKVNFADFVQLAINWLKVFEN